MGMKKVIIIGMNLHSTTFATRLAETDCENDKVKVVTNNIEVKNITNIEFEREPIEFTNHVLEYTEPKTYNDFPRNKFIDKPRHNFRKR